MRRGGDGELIMPSLFFITHPEVVIDPAIPVPEWSLSELGRERMNAFAKTALLNQVSAVYASSERKAIDGGEIIAAYRGLTIKIDPALGENDRSATGYVAPPEFWDIVAEFFARPNESIRGWERAADAQERIVGAVERIAEQEPTSGDIAIVSHGGVGCLLMAHLKGASSALDCKPPHPGGGCFFVMDRATLTPISNWRVVEDA